MIEIKNIHTAPIVITDKNGERHFILAGKSKSLDVEIPDGHLFLTAGWISIKEVQDEPNENPEEPNGKRAKKGK